MNIDHKNPIANGGSNTKRNLQVLCRTCNPQSTEEMSVGAGRRCKKVPLCFWDNGL